MAAVRILPLTGSHSPRCLPRMPSNAVLVSGPTVGAAQILIGSCSCVFLPPMSAAIRASVFSFVGALQCPYLFHSHRVCLVDCVDLICSLYGWWEGFGSSSLPHCPGFQLWFYFHSPDREAWQATVHRVAKSWTRLKRPCMHRHKTFFACGSSAPVRVEHEGGTAAWLAWTLAAPSVQGHGLPPLQELWPYQSLFSSLW